MNCPFWYTNFFVSLLVSTKSVVSYTIDVIDECVF